MNKPAVRTPHAVLAMLCLMFAAPCLAGNVYKCRNSQGNMEYSGSPCDAQKQSVSSWNAAIDPNLPQEPPMILTSQEGGHFFVEGKINGNSLRFLIDTGATTVSLPVSMQQGAKLTCHQKITMDTANGKSLSCVTHIAELRFGKFSLRNVTATLAPNLTQPLLGMNVLSQFRIEQDKNEMRISKRK
ncbi:MAG: TIGR02281 family clan AA aspartic protease [Gallionella sp.]|nr:TIGR02281 family clan AA aspartic protease [Gallionella sp.]MDD4945542.1 TIGR02281 family clan AA aspartic protease [Gallionella sp.]MDD5612204.1 TIGR02281 family clan AA aspartic protease [Gallionella sp.]